MELNGINSNVYTASYTANATAKKETTVAAANDEAAVVYEKSEEAKASAKYIAEILDEYFKQNR